MGLANRARGYLASTDLLLPGLCLGLSVLSVLTLLSVGQYGGISYGGTLGNLKPAVTQLMAVGLGLVGMLVLSRTDIRRILALWPLHVAVCWGLVLLTFVPGVAYQPGATGSQSWIALPLGMSIQPTELAKASFCLTFAAHLAHAGREVNRPRHLLPLLLHMAGPVLLVHLQGDDGGAAVFLAMGLGMLFLAGLNRWVVITGAAAALGSLPVLWRFVLSAHQKQRILALFRPEAYADTILYQQLQGRAAIRAGGPFGTGLFSPEHIYIPRAENDFIFAYFAQSCGLVGCLVLLGLLFGILLRVLRTAALSDSLAGAYICTGVFFAMLFQAVVNLGMNLMLLPVMGVTLPFVSAGGTSVLMLFLCTGLVMSVGRGHTEGYLRFLSAATAKNI